MRAKAGELRSELSATKKELSELDHHTSDSTSKMSSAFTKTAGYGKTLTVGIAGAAVAVGGFAIESAVAAQAVDAKLATSVKNAGGNMEELEPQIGKADARLRQFGFTNDQTNTALTTMTTALHDPQKALDAMGVAADLARAKNIDLNTASLMVAKAMEGQTRPLKALGIDLPVYAGNAQAVKLAQLALANAQQKVTDILAKTPDAVNPASKAHAAYEKALRAVDAAHTKLAATQSSGKQIMAALEQRVHGMASAYGDTLKGKIEAGKASVEAMGETLGKKLIPVVTGALGAAQKFVGWLGSHTAVLYTVAGVIGGVVVIAIGAYIASLVKAQVETVAKLALMVAGWFGYAAESSAAAAESAAATEASVIGQFATMIGAAVSGFASMVAAGAVWVAQTAAQMVKAIASGVVWIAQHVAMAAVAVVQYGIIAASATAAFIAENLATLGIIAGIALVIAAIVFLATHWTQVWGVIKAVVGAVWDFLKGVVTWIVNAYIGVIKTEISILGAIWGAIWHGIQAAVSAVWGFLKGVFSWVVGTFMAGIRLYIGALGAVWGAVWAGIKGAVSGAWSGIQAVFGWVKSGFSALGGIVRAFAGVWSSIWNGIGSALSAIYNNTIGPIVNTIKGAISGVSSAIGAVSGAVSSVGHFLGFDDGGWIPGPKGKPIPTIHHGGEYTLSTAMLEGRQKIDPKVVAAIAGSGPQSTSANTLNRGGGSGGLGGGQQITVIAQTNASAHRIAAEVGWKLRAMA